MQTKEKRTIVKQAEKAILYSDGTILVKDVRASYPHIFKPYEGQNDDGAKTAKYGIVSLMPKTKDYLPAKDLIRDHILQMIREQKLKDLPATNKFLRDGNLAAREEYEGMFTINASEDRRPAVRGNRRDPKTGKAVVLTEDDGTIYAGCWVNVLIRPWYFNGQSKNGKSYGKRLAAGLVAVQLANTPAGMSDEPFGQGRISEEDVDETFAEFTDDESGYEDDLGDEGDL